MKVRDEAKQTICIPVISGNVWSSGGGTMWERTPWGYSDWPSAETACVTTEQTTLWEEHSDDFTYSRSEEKKDAYASKCMNLPVYLSLLVDNTVGFFSGYSAMEPQLSYVDDCGGEKNTC